jgi:hypothetical protein
MDTRFDIILASACVDNPMGRIEVRVPVILLMRIHVCRLLLGLTSRTSS